MKRIHLFEFTDQPWYPQTFRRIQTDYLQYVATLGAGHKNLVPLFETALRSAGTMEIVDLCSGGTGPWTKLREELAAAGLEVSVTLTDKFPDPEAARRFAAASRGITYLSVPVDAADVPAGLRGMRTLFEGFHHFAPAQARSLLRDALDKRAAIGVFEVTLKPPFGLLLMLLAPVSTLLSYLVLTPFIAPRRFSRFFWTYLLPIVPLATCWDGVVSLLRVYSQPELRELIVPLAWPGYAWEIGSASTGTPVFEFTYLLGYPAAAA